MEKGGLRDKVILYILLSFLLSEVPGLSSYSDSEIISN